MAYVITQACMGAKKAECVSVCPCDSIHPRPDEPGFELADQLHIDPDTCIDCGLCAGACPTSAIYAAEDVPDSMRDFIERNARYYAAK